MGKSRRDGPENNGRGARLALNGFNRVRRGILPEQTLIDEEKALPQSEAVIRNLDEFCAQEPFATERVLPKSECVSTASDESGASEHFVQKRQPPEILIRTTINWL